MKKRNRKDAVEIAISYICTNCGFAAISKTEVEVCGVCSHKQFEVMKLRRTPTDTRKTFTEDERNARPI